MTLEISAVAAAGLARAYAALAGGVEPGQAPLLVIRLVLAGNCRGRRLYLGPGMPRPGDVPVRCDHFLGVPLVADPTTALAVPLVVADRGPDGALIVTVPGGVPGPDCACEGECDDDG